MPLIVFLLEDLGSVIQAISIEDSQRRFLYEFNGVLCLLEIIYAILVIDSIVYAMHLFCHVEFVGFIILASFFVIFEARKLAVLMIFKRYAGMKMWLSIIFIYFFRIFK